MLGGSRGGYPGAAFPPAPQPASGSCTLPPPLPVENVVYVAPPLPVVSESVVPAGRCYVSGAYVGYVAPPGGLGLGGGGMGLNLNLDGK